MILEKILRLISKSTSQHEYAYKNGEYLLAARLPCRKCDFISEQNDSIST